MRTTALVATALAIAACGKGEQPAARPNSGATSTPGTGAAAAATGAAPQPITGKTWDVKMIAAGDNYRFSPATLTIKRGDGVRWTLVAGPGHNVVFWADSIPSGASSILQPNMGRTSGALASPMLVNPSETYLVSFAGVPVGAYHYYCAAHVAFGMIGTIIVE
ncbi:MAG TPA: plastocyanin/azurin family copper-binding protein [Gemmatimonadaceae bacterium]|jgi:plastocyanin|nr:plastocyanin/azurin family copper-binding protein [Gemmatimonadaceae bacterium]